MIPGIIQQDIMKVMTLAATTAPAVIPVAPTAPITPTTPIAPTAPIAPTVPVTPVAVPVPVPSSPGMTGYHCYWMNSSSGTDIWELRPSISKHDCYMLDSCSGGMKQSGGGCYKWAASSDAKSEPW